MCFVGTSEFSYQCFVLGTLVFGIVPRLITVLGVFCRPTGTGWCRGGAGPLLEQNYNHLPEDLL